MVESKKVKNVPKLSPKDSKLTRNKYKREHPITEALLFRAMIAAINYIRDTNKRGFIYSQWMRKMGKEPKVSTQYITGRIGKTLPVFEEMISTASQVNPLFISLFFDHLYSSGFFTGLDSADAIDTIMRHNFDNKQNLNIEQLAEVLDDSLDFKQKLILARKLTLSINREAHRSSSSIDASDTEVLAVVE